MSGHSFCAIALTYIAAPSFRKRIQLHFDRSLLKSALEMSHLGAKEIEQVLASHGVEIPAFAVW